LSPQHIHSSLTLLGKNRNHTLPASSASLHFISHFLCIISLLQLLRSLPLWRQKVCASLLREWRSWRRLMMQRKCEMKWREAEEAGNVWFLFFPNKVREEWMCWGDKWSKEGVQDSRRMNSASWRLALIPVKGLLEKKNQKNCSPHLYITESLSKLWNSL